MRYLQQFPRVFLLLLVVVSGQLYAHSKVTRTEPADGATLSTFPQQFIIHFAAKTRLTKLTIAFDAGDSRVIDLSAFTAFQKDYSIPLMGDKGQGQYVIEWRGLSGDGHPVKGQSQFIVN